MFKIDTFLTELENNEIITHSTDEQGCLLNNFIHLDNVMTHWSI